MGFLDVSKLSQIQEHKTSTVPSCKQCGLFSHCKASMLKPAGEGKLGILIVDGEVSLAQENSSGSNQGSHYNWLKARLKKEGINIQNDCYYVNAVRCYTPTDPTGKTIRACASLLQDDIKRLKPKVIMVVNNLAWDVLFESRMEETRGSGTLWDYAGNIIPDQELKTWVAPIWPTKFLIEVDNENERKKKEYGEYYKPKNRFEPHYTNALQAIIETINKPLPVYEYESKVQVASNVEQAISFLHKVSEWKVFSFDYETSGADWHREGHFIHSVSFSNGKISYSMLFYKDNPEFIKLFQSIMLNDAIKIAHNKGFERSWSYGVGGVEPKNLKHDTMLMAHVWRNLAPTNLKYCIYREFGILGYDSSAEKYLAPSKVEKKQYGKNGFNTIHKAPIKDILYYCGLDSLFTQWLAEFYLKNMDKVNMLPGYTLLARAERPLTWMHLNGIHIDLDAIAYWKPILEERINGYYVKIMDSELIRTKWYGSNKFNPGSDVDLRQLVFNILKLKPTAYTDKGLPSVDSDALEGFRGQLPIADYLLEYKKWYKLLNTFIAGLEREQWDGVVHPYFTLNNVDSYRSASSSPNFQNISKHQKDVMKIIRSMIIPQNGHMLTSCDFSTLEVRSNAAITQDANLLKACLGSIDQHTELSKRVFMLKEVPKPLRSYVKTCYTFRWMYGGTGMQSAEASWPAMHARNANEVFGMDVLTHLKQNGINTYQEWEDNCVKAEKWFFGELFFAYQNWRKEAYTDYLSNGFLYYPNGFTYQGIASRNSLLNGPGQGAGSHVTLNALVGIFEEMEQLGMKSKLINVIHDDIMGCVLPDEEELFKKLLYKHMVDKKDVYNPWLNGVPLEVVYGKAPVGMPWADVEDEGVLNV